MDLTAYYSQFRDETAENLRLIGAGLVQLEASGLTPEERRSQVDLIFRAMHTIKGSARMLGFDAVGRVAHTCEHILGAVREGRRTLDRPLADDLLRGCDGIQELLNAQLTGRAATIDADQLAATLGRGIAPGSTAEPAAEPAPPVVASAAPAPPSASGSQARQTIRVRVDRLDRLLNLVGELAVGHQVNVAHHDSLASLEPLLARQRQALIGLERELARLRFSPAQRALIDDTLGAALAASEQVARQVARQTESYGQFLGQARHRIEDLEQEVMVVRLVPTSQLFAPLPRAVRDLAHEAGKEVTLQLYGETTELDRKVIEALADPVIHMIRNAIDHGIETPSERDALGKPRQGTVEVGARAMGAFAQISIRDDGRGMNPQRLRESAVRKRLLSAESAERLSDQEALELIFLPGFSTAQMITDISGRGVGMDVVRTNVMEIGGQVLIDSQPGQGTTITLALPLTLVTTRVLLVEVGPHVFAVPATGCRATIWARPEAVRTIEGRAVLPHEGRLAPLLRLADLLDVGGAQPFPARQRAPALVIGSQQRPLALIVDRLIDEREAVVKPLGPLLEAQRRYSGALQLGDGRLALLLNPAVLAQTASGMALAAPVDRQNHQARRFQLLVADDSFTTRELIRSILQSAGYEVTTAVDGHDALDKLRSGVYDLVVSDVEMPRIDGFQLTAQLRQELGEAAPPVIIVTSLASEAHRRRGLAAGAQAYIVKSQFNQGNLLETVQHLLA